MEEKDLTKLVKLARLECGEEEKKRLRASLTNVLKYIDLLKEVETEGVKPCSHSFEALFNVMREDKVGETLPRELFLSNAPAHTGGMVRVPPIMRPQE